MAALDVAKVHDALRSLYAFVEKQQAAELLGNSSKAAPVISADDESHNNNQASFVHLLISLNTIPSNPSGRAYRIPISHPIYCTQGAEMCLIVKDPIALQQKRCDIDPTASLGALVAMSQLKKQYSSIIAKQDLVAKYDLFLADASILSMLKPLLGKAFVNKKKQPVAVDISNSNKNNLSRELAAARDSTYLYLSKGNTLQIKIAKLHFTAAAVVDNITTALPFILKRLPFGSMASVQSMYIKTHNSIALPIYTATTTAAAAATEDDIDAKARTLKAIDARIAAAHATISNKRSAASKITATEKKRVATEQQQQQQQQQRQQPQQQQQLKQRTSKPVYQAQSIPRLMDKTKKLANVQSRENAKWLKSKTR